MKTVILLGHTKRAANKLKQHGNRWEILSQAPQGVLLRSLGCTFQTGPRRWEQDLRFIKFEKAQNFSIKWGTLEEDHAQCELAPNRYSEQREDPPVGRP